VQIFVSEFVQLYSLLSPHYLPLWSHTIVASAMFCLFSWQLCHFGASYTRDIYTTIVAFAMSCLFSWQLCHFGASYTRDIYTQACTCCDCLTQGRICFVSVYVRAYNTWYLTHCYYYSQLGQVRQQLVESLDKCCSGKAACDVNRLCDHFFKVFPVNSWHQIFDEHRRARAYVNTVCGWATTKHKEHFPEAFYVARSFLKGLSTHLTELFRLMEANNSMQQSMSEDGTPLGMERDGNQREAEGRPQTSNAPDFSLQVFLEDFIDSFTPEAGAEEVELARLERLFGELVRAKLFDHNQWVHNLLARGVFEPGMPSLDEDADVKKQHRCVQAGCEILYVS
jgi:hypothetical protein